MPGESTRGRRGCKAARPRESSSLAGEPDLDPRLASQTNAAGMHVSISNRESVSAEVHMPEGLRSQWDKYRAAVATCWQ